MAEVQTSPMIYNRRKPGEGRRQDYPETGFRKLLKNV
jgi:hypothetical protein